MQDIKDLYILCEPIDTRIGKLHFIKVKEYTELLTYGGLLQLEKPDILKNIKDEFKDVFDQATLLDLIKYFSGDSFNLYDGYKQLFQFCFKEDVFDLIQDDKELKYYLQLIQDMNYIKFEKPNPNPEIEKFNKFKKLLQKKNNDGITFKTIYTSVWAYTGVKPADMYIYEMYSLFNQVYQFKSYDTSTLFATVSKEAKIESWCKNIDIFNIEEKKMTLKDFKTKSKQIFGK